MPFRRLPGTDATRTTALQHLFTKAATTADADLPFPAPLRAQIESLQPAWKTESGQVLAALGVQTDHTAAAGRAGAALEMVIAHFIHVFQMAVQRGVFERADRAYYGLAVAQSDSPVIRSHADRLRWADRLTRGETARRADKPAQPPMALPEAAEVAAARAAYLAAHAAQSTAKDSYDREQEDVAGLRPQVDALVREVWDQIEFTHRRESGPSRRRKGREWGIVYVRRRSEAPEEEEEGGGTGDPVPAGQAARTVA